MLLGRDTLPGTYYTGTWRCCLIIVPYHLCTSLALSVNPQAVKEDLDVFTANHRAVQYLKERHTGTTYAFVTIGALLVGSIDYNADKTPFSSVPVNKGDDLGCFQYGGSTVVMVAPQGSVKWDDDLQTNSLNGLETLIQVGTHIGTKL